MIYIFNNFITIPLLNQIFQEGGGLFTKKTVNGQ